MLIPICWKYTEHSPETPLGISQASEERKHIHTQATIHIVMLYTAEMQFLAL